MSLPHPPIQPLPENVVAKVKSSISIASLNGVVVELVKNSLDADSRAIYINVDYQRGGCVVEDDGNGIPPAEFEQSGGLGKAHHTSKSQSREETYGRKGLFLASLAALSLLTITSRHVLHGTTNTVIFHHSKPVARLIPATSQQELSLSSHGTRVNVNDLFGNIPVRVKSRAMALQKPDEMDKEWGDLKRMLTAVMLANDRNTKLVISDAEGSRKFMIRDQICSNQNSDSATPVVDIWKVLSILTHAGFVTSQSLACWTSISARTPEVSIQAAISLVPSPTKQVQFISLGINPVFPRNNANVLFNEVNQMFALSDFGTVRSVHDSADVKRTLSSRKEPGANFKGASKSVNRWPMFYIRIHMESSQALGDEDNGMPQSDKSVQHILDVLGAMVYQFLEQHHFRPRAGRRKRKVAEISSNTDNKNQETSGKPADRSRHRLPSIQSLGFPALAGSTEESLDNRISLPRFENRSSTGPPLDFSSWSRIKSGRENTLETICAGLPRGKTSSSNETSLPQRSVSYNNETRANAESAMDPAAKSSTTQAGHLLHCNDKVSFEHSTGHNSLCITDESISWMDPITKTQVLINSRTGQVVPSSQSMAWSTAPGQPIRRPRSASSLPTQSNLGTIRRPSSALPGVRSFWLDDIIKKWDNPIFSRWEKPIASIDPEVNRHVENFTLDKSHCVSNLSVLEAERFTKFNGKLWKYGLEQAEVIAQVDYKFILIKMLAAPIDSNDRRKLRSILAIVDQHAADERCRIEQLFDDLFMLPTTANGPRQATEVQTTELLQPIAFEITTPEVRLFKKYSTFFALWGCRYEICKNPETKGDRVRLTALPTVIAERCRTELNLSIDILRGEIWKREETGKSPFGFSSLDPHSRVSGSENELFSQPRNKAQTEYTHSSWVKRIADCPQGIIDLLNSRACRSAIMFNDALSVEECRSLISRLARCVFPFQCAHGRPSMIPILDFESQTVQENGLHLWGPINHSLERKEKEGNTRAELGFAEAFRAWKNTPLKGA